MTVWQHEKDRLGQDPALPVRRRLLRSAQAGLYHCGLADWYGKRAKQATPCILMYHSVPTERVAPWIVPRNRMTPERFESQMQFLARHRTVVSLNTLLEQQKAGVPLSPGTVALTFDDGYRDNLEVVAPILAKHGLPATMYLTTGYVTRGENHWADVLYAALRRRRSDRLELDGMPVLNLARAADRTLAYRTLAKPLLEGCCTLRRQVLDGLRTQLGLEDDAPRLTLVWDEVRQLSERYPDIALGVHTANHLDLSSTCMEEAIKDLHEASKVYEAELGVRPVHFSFPYSRPSAEVRETLIKLGYRSAMTTGGRAVSHSADPFDLDRVEAPHSPGLLGYYTSGAHPTLSTMLFRRA